MKQAGLIAGVDVLRAQVQLQNQRQRNIRVENDYEKSKLQLARAIGLPVGQAFTLTDRIPFAPLATEVTLEGALKTAYESRADFLAARERLAAAEASRKAAVSDHIPTVRLDADYGALGQTLSESHATFRVAANVRVPLFDAGRSTARRIETDADLKRRQAEMEDMRGRVEYDVRTALLDLRAAGQQVEAAQTNVTLAGQELEQARDRFAAGVAGNLEVTQAQQSVALATESYIDALYSHNLAKASLARAVGTAEQSVMAFVGGMK
jgi:outer membrane protein TolC